MAQTGKSDGHRTASQVLNWQSEGETSESTPVGTIVLLLPLIIMPVLAAAQKLAHGTIPTSPRLVCFASEWARMLVAIAYVAVAASMFFHFVTGL